MTKPLSRRETRKALKEMPIESILMVGKSELTTKQKAFAKAVALGNTGAESYRMAYNTKSTAKNQGNKACELKADARIQREIESYQLAIEASKYRSSEALRSLVLHSLTQILIDPDTKPAQKIQAARTLGQVTEVAAFTERKEVTHVNGSEAIKSQIMSQLKTLMLNTSSSDVIDVESNALLAELDGAGIDSNQLEEQFDPAIDLPGRRCDDRIHNDHDDFAPDSTPPSPHEPEKKVAEPDLLHTIPHKTSLNISEPTPINSKNKEGGGV